MLRKIKEERPPTPVILAWMTAGVLVFLAVAALVYGLVALVACLT